MQRALAAICLLLMLALPCAAFAQPITSTHCHLCAQCDQMHTLNAQPCCDQQPIPTAPQQPQTLEAPAVTAHIALPLDTSAQAALHLTARLDAAFNPSPQRTSILRV